MLSILSCFQCQVGKGECGPFSYGQIREGIRTGSDSILGLICTDPIVLRVLKALRNLMFEREGKWSTLGSKTLWF